MRKWIALVLCVLALCFAISVALADSWDFLHSAFRLTSSADMERLAAENGLTLTQSALYGPWRFYVKGITLGGLAPSVAEVYRHDSTPVYECYLYFYGG